ncbi:hypothetical protein [Streptomyces sp. HUAS ZL42]|uniref:hypothetical protein n=1 Tax=Streptomyces sp. HUAS ZL42 TaxID=3231715 RepID=UPI00345EE192
MPQPDGHIEDYVLEPHDAAHYNERVVALQANSTQSWDPSWFFDQGDRKPHRLKP